VNRLRGFFQIFHPIVYTLLFGTILARAASSMSLPFLAIYLAYHSHLGAAQIGLVIGAGALASTFGGFIGGHLSDRFGRKKIMLAALYAWGFIFIGFSLATEAWIFLILNMLNGLCRSFFEPVSQALMADLTKQELRFRVFSLRYLAINIGVAVGPMLGAYFGIFSGGLPFLLTGIVYLIYAVVLLILLNRFGIKEIEGEKKEPITLGSAWNVIRRDVAFRFFLFGGVTGAIGYSQMTVTLSQYIQSNFAGGVTLFAALMSANAIVVVFCQIPIVRWVEQKPPIFAILMGNVMFALGDIGYALSSGWITFMASMTIFTLGEILNYPAANLLVDRLAPAGMRGTYYGAQTFQNLGQFIGPWIGGLLLVHYGGPILFVVMAAITLFGTLFYRQGAKTLNSVIK
jgi:MFS family permease